MLNSLRVAGRRQLNAASRTTPRRGRVLGLFPSPLQQRRHLGGIPTVLLPPIVFGGLVVTLWTWKCFMMVAFQNKIIYMPGLPPYARREKIEDYKSQCEGIQWKEERTKTVDGTRISLCVASVESGPDPETVVYILYFQGNASSLPPRLPFLSPVLRSLRGSAKGSELPVRYKMVCCSYRGYWTSSGSPSEVGITKDAQAVLEWIRDDSERSFQGPRNTSIVVWGQSIGAGVATRLAADTSRNPEALYITTLILETPFLSIKSMLETLYPQAWLPYRYLWPFLRNHLDTPKALASFNESERGAMNILILQAGKDELVPASHGVELEKICTELGFSVKRQSVGGALHTQVMDRQEGRLAVVEAICKSEVSRQ